MKRGSGILCRVSSECLPGTALFSAECDCSEQLRYSLELIAQANRGILFYLRQEGRGHGLATKIQALANKNIGLDTFSAVEKLGLKADIRNYSIVRSALERFQIRSIVCVSNSPDKIESLIDLGVIIESVANIPITANRVSYPHLRAKKERGHAIYL